MEQLNRKYYITKTEGGLPENTENGALYYVRDTNNLYIDISDTRKLINDKSLYWNGVVDPWREYVYKGTTQYTGYKCALDFGKYGIHNMTLVGYYMDEMEDGTKTTSTWISDDIITMRKFTDDYGDGYANWEDSDLREWLNDELYNQLSDTLKLGICPVKKTYAQGTGDWDSQTSSETFTCLDKLWIPSVREVYGSDDSRAESSGQYYGQAFAQSNGNAKYKKYGDDYVPWWLRTSYNYNDADHQTYVQNNKNLNHGVKDAVMGVAVGFCLV